MSIPFQLAFTRDFLTDDDTLTYKSIGLSVLDDYTDITHRFFQEHHPIVLPGQIRDIDAVVSLTAGWTRESLAGANRLVVLSRFGVGYDWVDVNACTEADVALCITTGAVDHSVAEGILTFMLALSHKLLIKDTLSREGRWHERAYHMGTELRERALGIIGLGGIGSALVRLVEPFKMEVMIYDPFIDKDHADRLGVRKCSLDEVMARSDFVSISCPLNAQTRNLITGRELALMKPSAYLITTARGGIVNESDLADALRERRIAGAGIDVYEAEPLPAGYVFSSLENVMLTPHSIAWTDEMFRDVGRMACRQVAAFSQGTIPSGVVNTEVLERPGFLEKLDRWKSG